MVIKWPVVDSNKGDIEECIIRPSLRKVLVRKQNSDRPKSPSDCINAMGKGWGRQALIVPS